MCPICLATTAAIVATGATSTGGLAAIVMKVTRSRSRAKAAEAPAVTKTAENHEKEVTP